MTELDLPIAASVRFISVSRQHGNHRVHSAQFISESPYSVTDQASLISVDHHRIGAEILDLNAWRRGAEREDRLGACRHRIKYRNRKTVAGVIIGSCVRTFAATHA